jgi:2-oxo-3-hexenedioate decarboxylase
MSGFDVQALAREIYAAYTAAGPIAEPPSKRFPGFGVTDAYAVEAELQRLRLAEGRRVVGRKVGYANKAMWRVLKLETLVWASMYDDTVRMAGADAQLAPGGYSRRIEPEIVIKLKTPISGQNAPDPAFVLECAEWLAFGFEVIDCLYPDWQFTPADFIAAFGFHRQLVIGPPLAIVPAAIPDLVAQLAGLRFDLRRNGEIVEEGAGKNSLRSPALCLAELARMSGLEAGEIISTGTLTSPQSITSGEVWSIEPCADPGSLPVSGVTMAIL